MLKTRYHSGTIIQVKSTLQMAAKILSDPTHFLHGHYDLLHVPSNHSFHPPSSIWTSHIQTTIAIHITVPTSVTAMLLYHIYLFSYNIVILFLPYLFQYVIYFYRYHLHIYIFDFSVYMHIMLVKYCVIFMHPPKCKMFIHYMIKQIKLLLLFLLTKRPSFRQYSLNHFWANTLHVPTWCLKLAIIR